MLNENTVTVAESVALVPTPKRTLTEASMFRLDYERDQLAQKTVRLMTLKPGTKGHTRCLESIQKTEQLIASIETKMSARMEKARTKAAANQNAAAPAVATDEQQVA